MVFIYSNYFRIFLSIAVYSNYFCLFPCENVTTASAMVFMIQLALLTVIPVHVLEGSTGQGTLLAWKQQHNFRIPALQMNVFWRDFWRPSVRQTAQSRGSYIGLPGAASS